jgi:hypothetical protein
MTSILRVMSTTNRSSSTSLGFLLSQKWSVVNERERERRAFCILIGPLWLSHPVVLTYCSNEKLE